MIFSECMKKNENFNQLFSFYKCAIASGKMEYIEEKRSANQGGGANRALRDSMV